MIKEQKKIKKKLSFAFLLVFTIIFSLNSISADTVNDTIFFSTISNSTIFINQTVTFDVINLTDYWMEIYNVTTEGAIFENFNATYNASLHVYDNLNNSLVYSTDGINHCLNIPDCDYNVNATWTPSNLLYILNDFNVTEDSTRNNSPMNLQGININEIELDSTVKANNVSVYLNEDCLKINRIEYVAFGKSAIEQSYTCENNVVSMVIKDVFIASSDQFLRIFKEISSPPSGGGSSGPTPTPTPTITEEDKIYKIDIYSKSEFKFGIKNYIFVDVYKNETSKIDIDDINIIPLGNIDYESFDLIRLDEGEYKRGFIINEKTGLSEVHFSIYVSKDGIPITEEKIFKIEKPTYYDVKLDKAKDFYKDNQKLLDQIAFISIIVASVVILIIILLTLTKRKEE